jgi:hypothetical protein
MSLHSLIANGGKILVVGGTMNRGWDSFRTHPQIVFWCGSQSEVERHLKNGNNFPDNVKGVIISRFISHAQSGKVIEEARRKRALIMAGKSDGEVTRLLDEIVRTEAEPAPPAPPAPTPAPPAARRPKLGEIQTLIKEHYNPALPNVDAAKALMLIAQAQGIETTTASLEQAVYAYKKKYGIVSPKRHGGPGERKVVPASEVAAKEQAAAASTPKVPATSVRKTDVAGPEDDLLKVIDDAMLSLQLVKDEVMKFKSMRGDYESLRAKLAALLKEA